MKNGARRMKKDIPREVINWFKNRLVEVRKNFPGHIPDELTIEIDIVPHLKVLKTAYFFVVILEYTPALVKKYPGIERDDGNVQIEFFRRKDFVHLNTIVLYHVGTKGFPPRVSLEGKAVFNDETTDYKNFKSQ